MTQADGSLRADVVTAQPLSSALKHRITELLGGKKKNIHISEHVDPSILGGIVVTLGNRLFDASLRTQLKDMYFAMKGIN
jgi:F-type H+-transporting ATPase subunit delta